MAAAGGQVLLDNGTARSRTLGDLAGADGVIDMVGLDPSASGATSYEGAAAPAATATQSANRAADGNDTDDNAADFTLAAPTPRRAAACRRPPPFSGSIAQIQGTDTDTSPHLDDTVTTTGVVTATLPDRRLQRLLHPDRRHRRRRRRDAGASDGIFVFTGGLDASAFALGDGVEVVGTVTEFSGQTQISATTVTKTDTGTRHRLGGGLPDHGRGPRGPRGRAAGPDQHLHGDQHLRHQHLRRDRAGNRQHARCSSRPTWPSRARRTPPPSRPTTPRAASSSTTARRANYTVTPNASGTAAPWLGNPTAGFNPVRVGASATFPASTSTSARLTA